jgi:hypothetical protein
MCGRARRAAELAVEASTPVQFGSTPGGLALPAFVRDT